MAAMRGRRRRAALAVAAGLVMTVAVAGCAAQARPPSRPADVVDQGYQSGDGSTTSWPVGQRKGPVTLSGTDYSGATQDVSAWRGHVVLLNTWYAACPPCRAEAPSLVAIANDDAAKGLKVLGINGTDAAGAANAFVRQFSVPFPSIQDTDGSAVAALQGVVPVNAVPTTVLLDKQGKVAARILGLADPSTLRSLVDSLLAEPADGSTAGSTSGPSSVATPAPSSSGTAG
ncbi:MAG: redoxin [Cellulomonas sp. 14-74-6]|nr:MAG: redoxin [Cellulomonas sp. 14-74-6]